MKDYIKVLLSDIKRSIKDYENQIETLEIKIEISNNFVEKLEEALKQLDKPEHNMLECPNCHHIDRDIHFKKVGVEDEN
jgi:hypothetical protein